MSSFKSPVVASSVALLAALSLAPTQGWARDGRGNGGQDIIYELSPLSAESSRDIIYEMPPLRPVKGATAQTLKPASKPAQTAEPALAAKPAPAPVKEAAPIQPPAQPAPVAEAPKPIEAPQPPVAEAPKAVETQPVAEAPALAPSEIPAPEAVAQEAAPAIPPSEAAPPTASRIANEPALAPAAQPVLAEAPAIVEPAPIGPPVMSVNRPQKALAALKAPAVAFAAHGVALQGDSPAPSLAPRLHSLAPEPAPSVLAAQPAAEPKPETEPQPQAQTPSDASVDPAAAQAASDARIAGLLAEGLVGPVEVRIGDRATMWLPAGRVFLPLETAHKLAQEAGLEWRPGLQGMVAPAGGKLEWLAPVELLDDGYIRTDDAAALRPDRLLAAFQASLPEVNAQRARAGQPPVMLDGWLSPPALNEKHRLADCVNISTQNEQGGPDKFFNCEAWALGRQGAIKIGLADGAEGAAELKDEAAALADTIVFDRGKTYEEFDAAADKTAPYAAADLLTRDVTATAAPSAPATEEGAPGASADLVSSLFYPAVFGAGALALYALAKRRRDARKDDEARSATAPAPTPVEKEPEPRGAPEAPVAAMEEPAAPAPSLLARLLPTLYARLAKKADVAPKPEVLADALAPAVSKAEPVVKEKPESSAGGLMGKIAALRSRLSEAPKQTSPLVASATASDAEEPVSALKKLAARMRRASEEPAPAPVNVSRVMRSPRGAAAAAVIQNVAEPLVVETERVRLAEPDTALPEPELVAPAPAMEQAREADIAPSPAIPEKPPGPQSMFDEDDFSLVEPGDVEAASSARDASRNRRATDL
ncbi:DUF2167 domain-containing protein [Methylocystis sp. JAN1]|uniref:DUF2167 domain-containing protein n=1 Tax=Methylocystis sp. JAN1 TaxID=3397211 RepID=UPI003FA30CC9